MVKDRKGIFALGVSLIAMSVAAPVSAADAPLAADAAAMKSS
jgi:hypothetical protein